MVNLLAIYARRVTIMPRDIRLALRIRGDHLRWCISSEDPSRYEKHEKRVEGSNIQLSQLITKYSAYGS